MHNPDRERHEHEREERAEDRDERDPGAVFAAAAAAADGGGLLLLLRVAVGRSGDVTGVACASASRRCHRCRVGAAWVFQVVKHFIFENVQGRVNRLQRDRQITQKNRSAGTSV